MNENEKEALLHTINSGELHVDGYVVKSPSSKEKLAAAREYEKVLDDIKFDHWLTDEECLSILIKNKLLSFNIDDNLKKAEKEIEALKVRLYNSMFNSKESSRVRKTLNLVRRENNKLISLRHSLGHLTREGFAEMNKRAFLLCLTLYKDGERVWGRREAIDFGLLDRLSAKITVKTPTLIQLRELARTDPWRGYWSIGKPNPFNTPLLDLSEEQKNLILLSKMYDSAFEHPESPPESVIHDDDLFDGWMIEQRKKNEKGKASNDFDAKNPKLKDAHDVFKVVRSQEDLDMVNGMNDMEANIIKKQRMNTVKEKGVVVDANFADRRIQIQQQQNQQFINKVRGR